MTTVEEWLDLTPEEVAFIDMKIRLGEELKARRRQKKLSQELVAKILNTSQGRVSKLEKGHATLDQLARSLLAASFACACGADRTSPSVGFTAKEGRW